MDRVTRFTLETRVAIERTATRLTILGWAAFFGARRPVAPLAGKPQVGLPECLADGLSRKPLEGPPNCCQTLGLPDRFRVEKVLPMW